MKTLMEEKSVQDLEIVNHKDLKITKQMCQVAWSKDEYVKMLHRLALTVGKCMQKLLKMDHLTIKWLIFMNDASFDKNKIPYENWQSLADEWYYMIKKWRRSMMNDPIWFHASLLWHSILPPKPIENEFLCTFRVPWLPNDNQFTFPMSVKQATTTMSTATMIINKAYHHHQSGLWSWYTVLEMHTLTSVTVSIMIELTKMISNKEEEIKST